MRPFVVAANWKMHKSPREAVEYFKSFIPKAEGLGASGAREALGVNGAREALGVNGAREALGVNGAREARNEIIFFVPAIDLWVTEQAVRGSGLGWGAQNCYFETKGAFTGENSPAVLAEIGAPYCLVGHSERRALFHETDEETGKKVLTLHQVGITPMLCVGESLVEREAGKTNEVIIRQLRAGLAGRDASKKVVIAYEPVWAIGTGKVATPEQANEAHVVLRQALVEIGGVEFANSTPILYGGSVKPENSAEIASQKEVDGFLVGGASLEVASFLALCQTEKR